MGLNRIDAISGVLVADAAALGLHWLYDQAFIAMLEEAGDVAFREPDRNLYEGRKGYFAQAGRHAGDLSHYGESARIAARLAFEQGYDTRRHQDAFFASFGPCGSFQGYADRPTRALVARIIQETDKLPCDSGMDDDQMPALCVVAGLFASGHDREQTLAAARVISVHEDVVAGTGILFDCLHRLSQGVSLNTALADSAASVDHPLSGLLQQALATEAYAPLETATRFGLACPVRQSMPVAWHLLQHAADFESVVRDNIRCGGDSCGRAMAVGAIAGMSLGVPASMTNRLAGGRLPLDLPRERMH